MSQADKGKPIRRLRIIVTAGSLLLALGHVILPSVKVDTATLALLALAVVPWLAPLIQSVELPGGIKVEMRDLREAERKAGAAGLLADQAGPSKQYVFAEIAERDPNLALAGLRIEIERRLKHLGESQGLDVHMQAWGSCCPC
jgi:hypothetical protein